MLSQLKRLAAILVTFIIAFLTAIPASAGIKHLILHQPTTKEPYVISSNAFYASYQWYVADLDEGEEFSSETDTEPVAGQTSSALTVTPDGKKYVCEVVWSDGVRKMTDVITNSYTITHNPTAAEPYVTLNNDAGAVFQWYRSNFSTITVAEEAAAANEISVSSVWSGSFSDGLWNGTAYDAVDIEFELKENQLLAVTPSAGFNGTVEEYGENFLDSQAGTYFYLALDDSEFNLCIENDTPFTAKVEIVTFTDSVPVDNQIDNILSFDADSQYYFCKITGNNNQKLTTQVFRYDFAVTHQPNAAEPYVEINTSENATYKWFELSENICRVTDSPLNENERELSALWVGSFADGKWKSNTSGTFEGKLFIQKGQTVNIVLPDNFEGGVGGLQLKNGAYTYTAKTNENFYIYLKNPTPFAFEIHISEFVNKKEIAELNQNKFTLPVDGKTYRCSVSVDGNELLTEGFVNTYAIMHQPTDNERFVEVNDKNGASYQWYKIEKKLFDVTDSDDSENIILPAHTYKGMFSGDAWQSQNGRLDFELSLKKNDVILVSLSDNLKHSVTVNEKQTSFSDGKFTYIVPCNGLFNLFVSSPGGTTSFSATIKVLRGVKGALLNDANAVLNAISNGEYLCSVMFSDGTKKESDFVTVTDGTLDSLEKALDAIAENATKDDTERLTQIAEAARNLSPADADETKRIKAISDTTANLLSVITQKSNTVTSLTSAVEEYDTDKLVPSDKKDLASIKSEIFKLLGDGNLTQNQKNTLTALLVECDELIDKIDSLNIMVSIINNPQKTEIKFGQTITLRASATDMPTGSRIVWYVDGEPFAEGERFDFSPESNSVITVKLIDENGNVIFGNDAEEISDSEQVYVKTNFFIKLINFFKKLFGISQTIIQSVI